MVEAIGVTALVLTWNNAGHLLPAKLRERSATIRALIIATGAILWLAREDVMVKDGLVEAIPFALGALAILALAVTLFRFFPALARPLKDRRIAAMDKKQFVGYTALRIPLSTAFVEELVFRGLIWFVFEAVVGPGWTLLATSVAFGLWHVVVAARQAQDRGEVMVTWVTGTVIVTALAGLGFGWLRMVTGGIWAPFVAHSVVNIIGSIGARSAARVGDRDSAQPVGDLIV